MSDFSGSFTTMALESVIIYGSSHLETGKWQWSLILISSLYTPSPGFGQIKYLLFTYYFMAIPNISDGVTKKCYLSGISAETV
jgi:hypothetical protein